MDLVTMLRGIRSLGIRTSLASLRYSFLRDRLNRQSREEPRGQARPPGQLLRYEQTTAGAHFLFQAAELEVEFLAATAARLVWTPGAAPPPYALANSAEPAPPVRMESRGKDWLLSSSELSVQVGHTGEVQYLAAGNVLRREEPPVRQGPSWRSKSALSQQQLVCGLGERAAGLNLRPGTYRFWNTDAGGAYQPGDDPLYLTVPLYHSLQPAGSYLLFYENSHDGTITFNQSAEVAFTKGQLRSLFILGDPRQSLAQFAELLDRPAMPPRWALGYHHSRWGYRDLDEINQVVTGFVDHDLPLAALHLDIDYMDGFKVFTQDPERFPDLSPLSQRLDRQLGAKLVTILDPGVKIDPNYRLYQEGVERQAFCQLPDGEAMAAVVWPGWVHFPDFSDPSARAWWGRQYQRLVDQGVAGFWHDMNEPTSFAAWGDLALPQATQYSVEGTGGDNSSIHNLYGLLMNQAGFEALQEINPEKRPWLLSRSGWAGSCRYAWNWTGDTASSWEMLQTTLTTVLGLGLSGIPFSGPDIGGFSGEPSRELYLRWFQLAAFMPFFRNHSSKLSPPREPWRFDDQALAIIRQYLNLRRQLMPYLYTLAEESHRTGWPMVRPLFWQDPNNPILWEVDDCFLLGDNVLVAPILNQGARARQVRLPPGTWVDYWTGQIFKGGEVPTVRVSLEQIPLFIRAGSVLPRMEGENLLLDIFPPEEQNPSHESSLYLDAGDGYGASRQDTFMCKATDQGWSLKWTSDGDYPFPFEQVTLQVHQAESEELVVDGKPYSLAGGRLQTKPFHKLHAGL